MKVLWITNILLPEATEALSNEKVLKGSGGWLIGAAKALLETSQVELFVAAPTILTKSLKKINGREITYYAIPSSPNQFKYWSKYEYYWRKIESEVKSDIVTTLIGTLNLSHTMQPHMKEMYYDKLKTIFEEQ